MRLRAAVAALVIAIAGCSPANPVARGSSSPTGQATPPATSQATPRPSSTFPGPSPVSSPTASPSTQPSTTPTVSCTGRAPGTDTVLVGNGDEWGEAGIYDVTDPVHPGLLCRVEWTAAHLSSASTIQYLDPQSAARTNIVLRSIAGGSESQVGTVSGWITDGAWASNGSLAAYTVRLDQSPAYPAGAFQVWTYTNARSSLLFTYPAFAGGCICRFGVGSYVLALSADGEYLAAGSHGVALYRLSDRTRLATFNDAWTAFWDRTSDRLFVPGTTSVQVWTPSSLDNLTGAGGWSFFPNMSPSGAQVAYTAWANQVQQTEPRVYLYDVVSGKTRMLIDEPRSQVVFVKNGWVWYLEEQACSDCPSQTQPTGKVFAMNISTGVEQTVNFAPAEEMKYATDLLPGEFWPNS